MKLKFTQLFLLLGISINLFAQSSTSTTNAYFYSSQGQSISCGNRTIIGQMNTSFNGEDYATSTIFEEDNKFYLEIADFGSTKFTKIIAQKIDIGTSGKAQFILPDSLKAGKTYLLKMSSTNPSLVSSNTYQLKFGIGLLPFTIDFQQDVSYFKESPQTYLNYTINRSDKAIINDSSIPEYFNESIQMNIKFSDNTKIDFYYYGFRYNNSFSVVPTDSISVYKIEEAVNQCGVKAQIKGVATVTRKDFIDKIIIKAQNQGSVCKNSKLTIEVNSKSFTPKTTFKVEFSNDYYFPEGKSTFVDVTLDKNNLITIDIPQNINELTYVYFRVVSQSPKLISNNLSLYITKATDLVYTYRGYDNLGAYIFFESYSTLDKKYYSSIITEVIVNGKDIVKSGELKGNFWRIPLPSKDTTFTFSKISNTCGNLNIFSPTFTINPDKYVYIDFKSNDIEKEVCQGKTVEYSFKLSNPSKADEIILEPYIYFSGNEFVEATQSYTGQAYGYGIRDIKYSINNEKNTITVNIPSDLDEKIQRTLGARKIRLEYVYLYISYYDRNFILNINASTSRIPLKLIPKLKLTVPSITINQAGYATIPIDYIGGNVISYELSNGQKGVFNHVRDIYCSGCQLLNSGIENISVLADTNTTFRIKSAENECALASTSGETNIIVSSPESASLIIDKQKIPTFVCDESKVEIPILKIGLPTNTKFRLHKRYYYLDQNSTYEEIDSISPFILNVSHSGYYNVDIWVETIDSKIKSNTVTLKIGKVPNNFSIESSQYSRSYQDGIEIIQIPFNKNNSSTYFRVYGYGGNLDFTLNEKKYPVNYKSGDFSQFSKNIEFEKDTLITFNSISNACGSVEVNRKVKFSKAPSIIYSNGQSQESFSNDSYCVGSKRVIQFDYYGEKPTKDSLIIQLAKYNKTLDIAKLSFFDVPALKSETNLTYTIPDSTSGNYVYRIKSLTSGQVSSFNYGLFDIRQKPSINLSTHTASLEILGTPGATLYLDSNLEQSLSFSAVLEDGSRYSNYDFGIYKRYSYDEKSKTEKGNMTNYGKYFSPTQTTTYKVKSVYNNCGYGIADGTATIKVQPTIKNTISATSLGNTFCSGDSLTIDLSYFGNFPKDTLMGVYLHTDSKAAFNVELATFKNNPSKISIKLPADIYSGNYFIQTRKKSRSKIYLAGRNTQYDSLANVNAKQNLDTDRLYLRLATPLNISLSGTTEIFVGNSAILITNLLNKNEQDVSVSKDTISFIYGMPYYFVFSDGSKYTSTGTNIIVKPLKTSTYSISSISNACGVGKASGGATITVLPKSDQRIESIGYFRNNREGIYESYLHFCANTKDSLDIKAYGVDSKSDFSKYSILLSDKDGKNYAPIKTLKSTMLSDSGSYKTVRIWHQFPENAVYGKNYRIKGISADANILSTPLPNPLEINELPTANLAGNASFITDEKVTTKINLTGEVPWLLSVIDKDGNLVYNGLPTKIDSVEQFKNYKPKLIYDNEFKLELAPVKANSYKIGNVYNLTCGLGKVTQGEFLVELILANESSVQNLIQIYPNPTISKIEIDLTSLNDATNIDIFDLNGKLIHSQAFDKSQIKEKQNLDFSQFSTGAYFIKVSNEKFLQTYRIIKF